MANNQIALTVVAHNMANINTPGYSKQRAEFAESLLNHSLGGVWNLNGAVINGIRSYGDSILGPPYLKANAEANYLNNLSSITDGLEALMNEMGEKGLGRAMAGFFEAAQNLNNYPTDISARENYLQAAKLVASQIGVISTAIDTKREELIGNYTNPASISTSQLAMQLSDVNQILEAIGDLNLQITQTSAVMGSANGLMDQRNMLLDRLSQYIPVNATQNGNGTINVVMGEITLIQGAKVVGLLEAKPGPSLDEPVHVGIRDARSGESISDNINSQITSGAVGAVLKAVTASDDGFVSIADFQRYIDNLTHDFATAVNAMQTYKGTDGWAMCLKTGADGELELMVSETPLFLGGPPYNAKSLEVNKDVLNNPWLIATARGKVIEDPDNPGEFIPENPKAVGNSDNMLATAALRNEKIIRLPGSSTLDTTVDKFITSLAGKLGLQAKDLEDRARNQQLLADTMANERLALVGVNMDEEIADMIKFQRAYEASARVFGVASEIFRILVNLGR
jgi:flagellar hook-associated protein 1 FlgK